MANIDALIDRLQQGELAEQIAAAEALSREGSAAQAAIPTLVPLASSTDEELQQWAVATLEEVGPPAASQIGELQRHAQDPDGSIAYWAVTLLGRAGSQAAGAASVLIERLGDAATPHVQQRAAWALGEIGQSDPQIVAALQAAAAGSGPLAAHAHAALKRIDAS
ncbi:MAG: HEAT repeat domain-containing protein [Pirellulales bacterium]|nr:HEAT repeat domain-containing protein [Pirellulales bacterium]